MNTTRSTLKKPSKRSRAFSSTLVLGASFFLPGEETPAREWSHTSLWLKKGDVVEVTPPASARRIRLEAKNPETGEWIPLRTGRVPADASGKLYLKIPRDLERSRTRLTWSKSSPLPYSYFSGRNRFGLRETKPYPQGVNSLVPSVRLETADASSPADATDQVQESDLWRFTGDKLYFYNQLRGLQVADLTHPNAPQVLARHRLPASGEQMYALNDGEYVALFARFIDPTRNGLSSSKLRLLRIEKTQVTETAVVDLGGAYLDSRLVGKHLYVLVSRRNLLPSRYYDSKTVLISYDLDNPGAPEKTDEQIFDGPGYHSTVFTATNKHLAFTTQDPANRNDQILRPFEIDDFSGSPAALPVIRPGGRILDKFKLSFRNGVLTAISQAQRGDDWRRGRYTLLENFDLSTGKRLGHLELAERETLYATRFDGPYAYIVTFLRTDPLFIIDLRDPAKPRLLSELIVPGWSEYIEPMGDRLFAVGVENRRVTASLFDVSDKAAPRLSHRVYLGKEGDYSWSEANYDEKAIGRLPSQNLFLIPYQTWNGGTYEKKVQVLEVTSTGLYKHGAVSHRFQPRRAAPDVTGNHVFSISGRELLVTDLTDRSSPAPLAQLPLAWEVDHLHKFGDKLLQIESPGSGYWGWRASVSEANATLRITSANFPDDLLALLDLGSGSLAGSALHGNRLHLARVLSNGSFAAEVYALENNGSARRVAVAGFPSTNNRGKEFQAFFPSSDQILWADSSASQHYDLPYHGARMMVADAFYPHPSPSTPRNLFSFSFEENLAYATLTPEANASLTPSPRSTYSKWSRPFLAGNRILYGLTATTHRMHPEEKWRILSTDDNSSLHALRIDSPERLTPLSPAELPGLLLGVHTPQRDAPDSILFTESGNASIGPYRPLPQYAIPTIPEAVTRYGRSLMACAYDGENAHYLDELDLSENSNGPLATAGNHVYLASPYAQTPHVTNYLLGPDATFQKANSLFSGYSVNSLEVNLGLLLGRSTYGSLLVADLSNPDLPRQQPVATPSGNLYPDLARAVRSSNGVHLPTGEYGVEFVPIHSASNASATQRRTGSYTSDWQEVDASLLRLFEPEEVPLHLPSEGPYASGWKFRPSSLLDQNVTTHEAGWKSLPWFGAFHARNYPWIHHERLGWTYVEEALGNSIWLWREKTGWLWTTPTTYPYLHRHNPSSWLYLDPTRQTASPRFYDFSAKVWKSE